MPQLGSLCFLHTWNSSVKYACTSVVHIASNAEHFNLHFIFTNLPKKSSLFTVSINYTNPNSKYSTRSCSKALHFIVQRMSSALAEACNFELKLPLKMAIQAWWRDWTNGPWTTKNYFWHTANEGQAKIREPTWCMSPTWFCSDRKNAQKIQFTEK